MIITTNFRIFLLPQRKPSGHHPPAFLCPSSPIEVSTSIISYKWNPRLCFGERISPSLMFVRFVHMVECRTPVLASQNNVLANWIDSEARLPVFKSSSAYMSY